MMAGMMTPLAGALYALLAFYLGGWWIGRWAGNFSLLLFLMSVATFAFWLAERFHFRPAREAAARALEQEEQLRGQRRLLAVAVETLEEWVLLGLFEDQLAPETPGETFGEARLPDPDRSLDDDVARPLEPDDLLITARCLAGHCGSRGSLGGSLKLLEPPCQAN